jgi:hypothetical protein
MSEEPSGERPAAGVRASDAEREAVVARLHGAVAEGRIDLEEFGERVQAAYAAITTADLAGLLADLPPEGTMLQAGAPGPASVEIVGEPARSAASSVTSGSRPAPRCQSG